MDIRSVLVNVDLEPAQSSSLRYAIDLAQKFDAELIGVAADYPNMLFLGADVGTAAMDFYIMERAEIEKRLCLAEEQFRAAMPSGLLHEWRAGVAEPNQSLLNAARRADLIVTGSTMSSVYRDRRLVDLGELVVGAGRPVLDVAKDATIARLDKLFICWKDTREARRAVADAMPFLKQAREIAAITVSEGDADNERTSLDDLVSWLATHGVAARPELIDNRDGYDDVIETTAILRQADLVITGGYGHSRMREWLFGGVTRNLLKAERLTRFFSN